MSYSSFDEGCLRGRDVGFFFALGEDGLSFGSGSCVFLVGNYHSTRFFN